MPEVTIPEVGGSIDLYSATGITVGTQIRVQNKGNTIAFLTAEASAPANNDDGVALDTYTMAVNGSGDAGAWAACLNGAKLNVEEA